MSGSNPPEIPLSVIIFAYNEQENLPDVLEELNAWLDHHEPRAEIIFVDDGSTDGTLGTARDCLTGRTARFARHDHNRGIGAALKTAVALTRGEWVTFLPADGQIPPAALGILRTHARNNVHHELVFSIYDGRDDGALRTFLSFGVRALIWCVHGVRMRSDGPYLFRREIGRAHV